MPKVLKPGRAGVVVSSYIKPFPLVVMEISNIMKKYQNIENFWEIVRTPMELSHLSHGSAKICYIQRPPDPLLCYHIEKQVRLIFYPTWCDGALAVQNSR